MHFDVLFGATLCTAIPVSFVDGEPEICVFGQISNTMRVPLPVSVGGSAGNAILILVFGESAIPCILPKFCSQPPLSVFGINSLHGVDMAPVIIGSMPRLEPHTTKGGATIFGESPIPCGLPVAGLLLPTSGVVAPLIDGDIEVRPSAANDLFVSPESPSHLCVGIDREGFELFATATCTDSGKILFLRVGNTHSISSLRSILQKTEKDVKEKLGELRETPNVESRAIRSRPLEGIGSREGSEARRVSPNNNPSHEHPARNGKRWSEQCREVLNQDLNGLGITKLNSVPYTGKLNDLSEHPITEIINKVLKFDARNFFDTQAHAQFLLTALIAAPDAGTSTTAIALTTNTVATQTAAVALRKGHVVAIVDTMKERNIPAYTGDDYYAIAHPTTFTTLRLDLEGVHQYTTEGFQMIKNGEIGRYNNCRFVEQSHIAKEANVSVTDWAFFFGSDTVAEAIAVPEEIRGKIPSDYGRSKGVAWYYLGGFGCVHTTAAQCRIVKWDSAT